MKKVSSAILLSMVSCSLLFGYGERTDTIPDWQERAMLTLCNMCRLAPEEYRDAYLGTTGILLPTTYPAVPPLVWNYSLNASARYHAVEMAGSCGMQHNCNGMTYDERIKLFYKESASGWGENIAKGYSTPQDAVKAWLLDRQGTTTAADGSGQDGHRANIMSKKFNVVGCGYFLSGSGSSASALWCQDFASGRNSQTIPPVPSASHLFFSKGTVTFLMTVYDTALSDPKAVLLIDNSEFVMSPASGKPNCGTYSLSQPAASACRPYCFELRNGTVTVRRYPDSGYLLTTGEGGCTGDFSAAVISMGRNIKRERPVYITGCTGKRLVIDRGDNVFRVTRLFDVKGALVKTIIWNEQSTSAVIPLSESGMLIINHTLQDGSILVQRFCRF